MKMVITEHDVQSLVGKFVLQVDSDRPDYTIGEGNWSFVKEKRLSMVGCDMMCKEYFFLGLYYMHGKPKTIAEFVDTFNHYTTGESRDKRFHRLLTNAELDFVLKKMKESNY